MITDEDGITRVDAPEVISGGCDMFQLSRHVRERTTITDGDGNNGCNEDTSSCGHDFRRVSSCTMAELLATVACNWYSSPYYKGVLFMS